MPVQLSVSDTEYRDNAKLIVWKGRKSVRPDRKRDLAKQAGVECIHLIWTGGKASDESFLASAVSVSGFQALDLALIPRPGGGYKQRATWRVDSWTALPKDEGTCQFVPDEMGIGHAYVPDSPHNRVKLAYSEIGQNALWRYADESAHAEIRHLAQEIKASPEYKEAMQILERKKTETKVRREEMAARGEAEEKQPVELENIVIERKIKQMEAQRRNQELKAKLAQFETSVQVRVEKSEPVQAEKPKKKTSSLNDLRKKAKEQVYEENASLVQKVKNTCVAQKGNTRGWAMTSMYMESIRPLVEERLKELKDANEGTRQLD